MGLLARSYFYELSQSMLGANAGRKWLVENFIKPFPGARLLDIGCGPAEILRFLPEDVNYVGLDLNKDYIDSAKKKHGSRAQFYSCDIGELSQVIDEEFDLILGIGFLHHLSDSQTRALLKDAKKLLAPQGRFLTLDGVWVDDQHWLAKLLLKMDRGEFIREPEGYIKLLSGEFGQVASLVKNDLSRVPYSHILIESKA